MPEPASAIERRGRNALVRLQGDLIVATAASLDALLRTLAGPGDLDAIRLDFSAVGRVDSSAYAVIAVARRRLAIELDHLPAHALALFDSLGEGEPGEPEPPRASRLEWVGARIIDTWASALALARLVGGTLRTWVAILLHRTRLPAGVVGEQVALMGADAGLIVSLLSLLLGMSVAFQGAVQLRNFGAGPYVADLVGLAMVREFGPLVAAIIVTGRTGAAIAAELGTMQVSSEIDALDAMGIDPTRFLVAPRLTALTIVQPVLTVLSMLVGITGGMIVACTMLHMSPASYWLRTVNRLDLTDFARGIAKSIGFAWIIGFSGAHLGMRARRDASGVGLAATRAVVAAVFFIITFDAAFEAIAAGRIT